MVLTGALCSILLAATGFTNKHLRVLIAGLLGSDYSPGQTTYNLHAPRGALSYPRSSREELEGRFLGLMAYLDAKARGDSSLPEKQRSCSGV
jgi:hypothetical protein